jgi:hypothetical protein
LFVSAVTVITIPTGDVVIEHDPVALLKTFHPFPNSIDNPGDFVPQGQWEWIGWRYPCPIMHIGMADPSRPHLYEHVPIARLRNRNFLQHQRFPNFDKTNCFHSYPTSS